MTSRNVCSKSDEGRGERERREMSIAFNAGLRGLCIEKIERKLSDWFCLISIIRDIDSEAGIYRYIHASVSHVTVMSTITEMR